MTAPFTFVVKTFERPQCLARLVESVRRFYPDERMIVVDDGEAKPAPESPLYDLVRIPFDSGLSEGRNVAVDLVETPFFVLLDDDFVFTEDTRVGHLVDIAERHNLDIVGGDVIEHGRLVQYHGNLEREGETLRYVHGARAEHDDHTTHDMVLNFFAGRTESIRKLRWDPTFKVAEHTEFFWRAKGVLSVAHVDGVTVVHTKERDKHYRQYRGRAHALFAECLRKHGFRSSVNFKGVVFSLNHVAKPRRTVERYAEPRPPPMGPGTGERDLVYPYLRPHHGERELVLSLRAACANMQFRNVVIIGDKPERLAGFTHIPHEGPTEKFANAIARIGVAAASDEVSPEFVLMNDDMFQCAPVVTPPHWWDSTIGVWVSARAQGRYRRMAIATMDIVGRRARSFSTHSPFIYDQAKLLDVLERHDVARGLHLRTLYAHTHGIEGEQIPDRKARSIEALAVMLEGPFASCTDDVAKDDRFLDIMTARFPEPSPFEVAA